ncbi:phosphate-import protein PhnD precursor [bacterium BMS3Bbin05]|nr:phosphate-import protein PhnD precursor [bacterium BMS3Bbin05]
MKRSIIFLSVLLSLFMLICPDPCKSEDKSPGKEGILIGLIPEENIFKQMERYMPLAGYISEKIGRKVKFTILSKYGDIIDRFNSRGMDGAFLGGLTTVIAYEKLGVIPLVTVVDTEGNATVRGHIIVRRDGVINSPDDMKGKIVAFVDRASITGYLFPVVYMKEHGINNIRDFFSEVFFTGSCDASVYAVLDGRADVGFVNETELRDMISSDVTIKKELKIIATSPDMPNVTLSLSKRISEKMRKKLLDTLLDISNNSKGREVLKRFGAGGFRRASVNDFTPVYRLLKSLNVNVKEYNYRNK